MYPLLIACIVCHMTKMNRLIIEHKRSTHIISVSMSRLMLLQLSLWLNSKRNAVSSFSVIEFFPGDLMNHNEEFPSSTEAEVTGSTRVPSESV